MLYLFPISGSLNVGYVDGLQTYAHDHDFRYIPLSPIL